MADLRPTHGQNPFDTQWNTYEGVSHNVDGTQIVDGTTIHQTAGSLGIVAGGVGTTQLANAGPGATGPVGDGTNTPVITIDAKGRVTALTTAAITGGGGGLSGGLATFTTPGVLPQAGSVGVGRFLFPFPASLQGAVASVNTAPTGAAIIVDVNLNGTTIFSTQANRPTIAAGNFAVTTQPTPNTTTAALYDYLTVDIDQVGSTVVGADLTVLVLFTRTA